MNLVLRRNRDVNDAAVESLPPLAGSVNTAESFESLYRRTFPRVYGYVASLLHDPLAAEEVTAQAFERAYRRRRTYRSSRGTADAWVFGIARNAALDELRRLRRHRAFEADPEAAAPGPEEEAESAIRRETVRRAIGSLEARDRDLVALKFAGGLTNSEISRVLGISETNVGTRLHRTIEKLREACRDYA
jgi:RNA polymerase sigma factor (sigma-70 family)